MAYLFPFPVSSWEFPPNIPPEPKKSNFVPVPGPNPTPNGCSFGGEATFEFFSELEVEPTIGEVIVAAGEPRTLPA